MKHFKALCIFSVLFAVLSSYSFVSVSALEYETGLLPIPVVNDVSTWLESSTPVHFGQQSASVSQEGFFLTPVPYDGNHFDTVYMTPENVKEDLYASTGYYHGGYVSLNTKGVFVSSSNFVGGPQMYMTFGEQRTLAPGGAIEFYIWVGNIILRKQLGGGNVYFNCVGGVRLGDATEGGTIFQPDSGIKGIDYQITTFKDKSYSSNAADRRLCQKIKIVNNSNAQYTFTGMQLVFANTDVNGNILNQDNYGFDGYYVVLSISDFLTYNTTSRNQEYLDSIGGTIGTFDDKFDNMTGSLGNINNGVGDVSDALQDLNGYFTGVPDLDKWASEQSLIKNISNNLMDRVVVTPLWSPIEPLYVSFMNVMWNCVDRLGRLGVPYNNPQLSFIELSKTDESKTGYFNLYDFVMWYTSIFLTRAVIFAVSAKCRDLDKPIGDDEE